MSIKRFKGKHQWLSNFYYCPVLYKGHEYNSSEHAYQAAKAVDELARVTIEEAETASMAKRLGRIIKMRPDWEEVKVSVMDEVLRAKFHKNGVLADRLSRTGDTHLEEGNNHGDRYWGTVNGKGRNELGKALMRIRTWLRQEG